MIRTHTARDKLNTRIFRAVHRHNLIYNTCWEDPALDRQALDLGPDDRLVVITSAGCNALDYLLAGCGEVNAVDVNPIQNALLELKTAACRTLDYDSFFSLFGKGRSPYARQMYFDSIRPELSAPARALLGQAHRLLPRQGLAQVVLLPRHVRPAGQAGPRQRPRRPPPPRPHRGAAGGAQRRGAKRDLPFQDPPSHLDAVAASGSCRSSLTLSLLGVPWPQRDEITTQYPGGVAQFIRDALEAVVTELPFHDNYFWRVYFQGHYTLDCCPEYLRKDNFERLRSAGAAPEDPHLHRDRLPAAHRAGRVAVRAAGPHGLDELPQPGRVWWTSGTPILDKAAAGARAIFRSAGLKVSYLDHLRVQHRGREVELGGLLRYNPHFAAELHAQGPRPHLRQLLHRGLAGLRGILAAEAQRHEVEVQNAAARPDDAGDPS